MNSVAQQNKVTDLRLKMKSTLYRDPTFVSLLEESIKRAFPIYNSDYNYDTNAFQIIIDKNQCETIPGFEHKKEFYTNFILRSYLTTLHVANTSFYKLYPDNPDRREMSNLISEILIRCKDGSISAYNLFDVTVILDNVVMFYL